MIHVTLVFDNVDNGQPDSLHSFFESCASDFRIFSKNHKVNLIEIAGKDISHQRIHAEVSALKNRSLFVSFSHGRSDSLICSHNPAEYVSVDVNLNLFSKAFFYTWSCFSSTSLGAAMISGGCSVYWGYAEKIWAPTNPEHQGIFIQCATRGLEQFIKGKNVEMAKDDALEFYDEKIDDLADENYPMSSRLRFNRDAMEVHGEMALTIKDYHF